MSQKCVRITKNSKECSSLTIHCRFPFALSPANTARVETSFADWPLEVSIGGKGYVSGPLAPITPGPDDNLNDGLELQGSTGGTMAGDAKDSDSEAFYIIAIILGVLALLLVGFAMRARRRNKASPNAVLSTPLSDAWADNIRILINRARLTTFENGHCKLCLGTVHAPIDRAAELRLPSPARPWRDVRPLTQHLPSIAHGDHSDYPPSDVETPALSQPGRGSKNGQPDAVFVKGLDDGEYLSPDDAELHNL